MIKLISISKTTNKRHKSICPLDFNTKRDEAHNCEWYIIPEDAMLEDC